MTSLKGFDKPTKLYVLRSNDLLDKDEISQIPGVKEGRYSIENPKWRDGQYKKSTGEQISGGGWYYELILLENKDLIVADTAVFKTKGLELIAGHVLDDPDIPAFLRKVTQPSCKPDDLI